MKRRISGNFAEKIFMKLNFFVTLLLQYSIEVTKYLGTLNPNQIAAFRILRKIPENIDTFSVNKNVMSRLRTVEGAYE